MTRSRWAGLSGSPWCVTWLSKHVKQLTVCGLVTIVTLVLLRNVTEHGDTPASYTYVRGHIVSSGNYSHIEQMKRRPVTKETLSTLLPDDVNAASFPDEFFQCRPSQVLRMLHTYHDLNRFDGCGQIFYNRVPKCGSRTVLSVFRELAAQNNYTLHSQVRPRGRSYLGTIPELVKFGMNFSRLQEPFLYSQHLHFVNFTQMGVAPPLFINVVRDPVERVISHFNYHNYGSGSNGHTQVHNVTIDECVQSRDECSFLPVHQTLSYFCGQEKLCRLHGERVLQRAKASLKEAYLVVGLTEDLPSFFGVLQTLMPNFFSNASTVYHTIEEYLKNKTQTTKKPKVLPKTIQTLRDELSMEYDFYKFAKQRFYTLHNKIKSLSLDKAMEWTDRHKRSTAHAPGSKHNSKHKRGTNEDGTPANVKFSWRRHILRS